MITDEFPRVFTARQRFEGPTCANIAQAVSDELKSSAATSVAPGQSVAITAGSRGITNIAEIIKSIAEFFQGLGAKPFVVPAMGKSRGRNGRRTAASHRVIRDHGGILRVPN